MRSIDVVYSEGVNNCITVADLSPCCWQGSVEPHNTDPSGECSQEICHGWPEEENTYGLSSQLGQHPSYRSPKIPSWHKSKEKTGFGDIHLPALLDFRFTASVHILLILDQSPFVRLGTLWMQQTAVFLCWKVSIHCPICSCRENRPITWGWSSCSHMNLPTTALTSEKERIAITPLKPTIYMISLLEVKDIMLIIYHLEQEQGAARNGRCTLT